MDRLDIYFPVAFADSIRHVRSMGMSASRVTDFSGEDF